MSAAPLVSVIISSYNHAPYVEDAIRSVLAQTYPRVELLVVDDGSTDDSAERIARLQAEYGFDFRVQENKGLTRTLNDAVARARGELIAPLGSDDIMLPERLAIQTAYLADKPEVGICAGNIELIHADGTPFCDARQSRELPFRRLDFDDMFNERKPGPAAPTLLIRREAFERVGGFDPAIRLEDLYIELKITHAGYFIDVLGDVLARYRKHDTNSYRNLRFMTDAILRIYRDYADDPRYDEVRLRFLNSMFVKSANRDRALARELLAQLPLRSWNGKTVRGMLRYLFSRPSR
ncbi:MAG: glycosyltransferase [Aromatoleum sp.]|jgi:alpha-1,3-rhamnosyltransferase|uniref:glycosyltransferase n=1 Tax=Aromatoleum sp. TaxID=2307007 RepID=UPI0028947F6F|nr:glycosyltransferase [Aromatoleum sp.]MDT3670432.1 glycosyltransferase [Aromatoleum sp.]